MVEQIWYVVRTSVSYKISLKPMVYLPSEHAENEGCWINVLTQITVGTFKALFPGIDLPEVNKVYRIVKKVEVSLG